MAKSLLPAFNNKDCFSGLPPLSFPFHILHIPLSNFEFATLPTSNKLLILFASLSPSLPQFFNRDESRTLIFFFSQVIRDEHLFLIVGAIVLLDILLLSLWSGIEPMHTGYQRFIEEVWYCSSTMWGNCSRSEGANDSEIISLVLSESLFPLISPINCRHWSYFGGSDR